MKTKKTTSAIAFAVGLVMLYSCGQNAEQIAARDKAIKDSIALVEKTKADDMIAAQAKQEQLTRDSISNAKMQAMQDSMIAISAASKDAIDKANQAINQAKKTQTTVKKNQAEVKKAEEKKNERPGR